MEKRADIEKSLNMADVSGKEQNLRTAKAEGFIKIKREVMEEIIKNGSPKGDVFIASKIAGIMAAKNTSSLLPLCHKLNVTHCDIKFEPAPEGIRVIAEVKAYYRTGVEMEALTAVSATLLNIYDMVKPISKRMDITDIKLLNKTGGKSGDYVR